MAKDVNDPGRHTWKACARHNRAGGSNPPHSARISTNNQVVTPAKNYAEDVAPRCILRRKVAKKTTINLQTVHKIHVIPQISAGRLRADGTTPVRFAINYRSGTAYIPTSIYITPAQWVGRKVVKHPNAPRLNGFLNSMQVQFEEAALEIAREGLHHGKSAKEVRDLIIAKVYPEEQPEATLNEVLAELAEQGRGAGTRSVYRSTLSRLLERYPEGVRFDEVTPEWLRRYDDYLAQTGAPSKNARNIHLRNIRRAFNVALDSKRTTAPYPFRNYSIKPEPTPANAYTVEELRRFMCAEGLTPIEYYWRDMFALSFALRGCNLADLEKLTKIERGRINYNRQKTGRKYSVEVLPCAARIIARHASQDGCTLLDLAEKYAKPHAAIIAANKFLKRIAAKAGTPYITFYTARYSWATIAANECGASIELISLALGHTYGRAVTLGYINPDIKKVDQLNRQITALILE